MDNHIITKFATVVSYMYACISMCRPTIVDKKRITFAEVTHRDVSKDLAPKDQNKDKDLTPKDQDKDKDLTLKLQDKNKDLKYVLKESLRSP